MSDQPLPNQDGVLLETYSNRQFGLDASRRFPDLAQTLAEARDSLHLQLPVLGQAVRNALAQGNVAGAADVCSFIAEALEHPRADSEIENAVAISFVEESELQAVANGPELLSRMPSVVRRVLAEQARRDGAA